ncbi:MAG: lectin-like protein [Kofleriaceae bacterium]
MRWLLTVLLAACSASVDVKGTDAAPPADGPRDTPPIDARPCEGGTGRGTAPDGACVVRFDTPATYADAAAACVAFGSQLAIVNTSERDALARTLAGATDLFIGLTDQATEGAFVWSDGTAVGYTNFYLNEPNDGSGVYPEDCIVINGVRGGQWDDRRCAPDPATGAGGVFPYLCMF